LCVTVKPAAAAAAINPAQHCCLLRSCSKTLWGFPLLTRVYGSALPRSFLPALLSGLIALMLILLREHVEHLWVHPYPYQPLVLIATFVLTFR
jgi:hypothetical protein